MFRIFRAGAVILLLLIGIVLISIHPRARHPDDAMPSLRENRRMPRNSMRRLREQRQ